jgi:hypothetical protein
MDRRTRLFVFPGGMLEVNAYADDSDDDPGVYLELSGPAIEDTEDYHDTEVS